MSRPEDLLTGEEGMGDDGAEGSSATADGGRAAVSPTPDADGKQMRTFESSQLEGLYVGD